MLLTWIYVPTVNSSVIFSTHSHGRLVQGCESSDFNLISDFLLFTKPHFQKQIFSGISDYFRLLLTEALTVTPLLVINCHDIKADG